MCYSPPSPSAHLLKRPLASISSSNSSTGGGSGASLETSTTTTTGAAVAAEDHETKVMDESNVVEEDELSSSSSGTATVPAAMGTAAGTEEVLPPPSLSASTTATAMVTSESPSTCPPAPLTSSPAPRLPASLKLRLDGCGTGGRGRPYVEDTLAKKQGAITAMYHRLVGEGAPGLTLANFGEFTNTFCRLPGFLQASLFERVVLMHGAKGANATSFASPSSAASPSSWDQEGGGAPGKTKAGCTSASTDKDDASPSPPSMQMASAAIGGDDTTPSPSPVPATSAPSSAALSLEALLRFWVEEMAPFDAVDRLFRLLKQPKAAYIVKDDLFPFLRQLLETHPGLEFLRTHPDFQQKYALTVAARIFYSLNRAGTGKISAKELRRSKLLEAMCFVDENEDINKETSFFSYEHFYVLYCRFWELDTDRDGALSREDLLKYGDHSLSNAIVDRIFEVGARPFEDGLGGKRSCREREKMQYEDFIFFMLSEEDKGNEASLRYWFHCVDVDGDGRLSFQDMRYFYNIQLQRMEWLGHELVPFEDVLCQMLDMLKPTRDLSRCRQHRHVTAAGSRSKGNQAQAPAQASSMECVPPAAAASPMAPSASLVAAAAAAFAQEEEVRVGGLHVEDFLLPDKIKIAGVFFDALFNLNKFLAFEQRDPFGDRQKREDPFDCDWERFAYRDYQQLAMDEEENEGGAYSEEAEEQQVTSMDIEEDEEEEEEEDEEGDEDAAGSVRSTTATAGSSVAASVAEEDTYEEGGVGKSSSLAGKTLSSTNTGDVATADAPF